MAKGDDALARKRNKVRRKRMRSSENAVSARVAGIIASKRRRKSGKRRACEGMCFSLPTPEDPFNDRHGKKRKGDDEPTGDAPAAAAAGRDESKKKKKKKKKDSSAKKQPAREAAAAAANAKSREKDGAEYDRPSKFLVVCLNAIRDAAASEDGGGGIHDTGSWGVELWNCCSAAPPTHVLDTSGECATREKTAWLVSTACDIVARKEKLGVVVSCPFLLYLVPSQEKAVQVRSICKPLKSLGIHSVSLHPGASIEHQISGLKSCEPEFLISTPERLLELIALKAIDISGVSMLVIDGLKCFTDLNVSDKLCSIRDAILSNPQITIFSDPSDRRVAALATKLVGGKKITRLCTNDSVTSRSAFITQKIHICPSKDQKAPKKQLQISCAIKICLFACHGKLMGFSNMQVKEILEQILNDHARKTANVLLVTASDHEAQHLSSSLKLQNCTVTNDSHGNSFTICSSVGLINVLVKDWENITTANFEDFDTVLVADLPPSVDEYIEILAGASCHVLVGEVHCIFSSADALLAKPLSEVLTSCGQVVPEFLRKLASS
uniref:DEAD/DEAH-box helicase domain-containing protein n=1 Tax=Oryza barthii TaxID=65489 RepID=A0A0D3HRF7_9ORYZ